MQSLTYSDASSVSGAIKTGPAYLLVLLATAHMALGACIGHLFAVGRWSLVAIGLTVFGGFQILQIINHGGALSAVLIDTALDYFWLFAGVVLQLYGRAIPAHHLILGLLEWADVRRTRRR